MAGPLRVLFMGSAGLACPSLEMLAAMPGVVVVGVVTQPDRPSGRRLQIEASPVKQAALRLGHQVFQPASARSQECLLQLREMAPDVAVVAAYGQILPIGVLNLPPHGCLNIHASLLPRHRGASPIQAALLAGDSETGVTLMKMDEGLDTGGMLAAVSTSISPKDTAQTLHDRLAQLGAQLLRDTLPGYLEGALLPRPQPAEGVTYAGKVRKEDGLMDWRLPAEILERRIRAYTPWPGAFTTLPATELRLLKIRAADIVDRGGPAGCVLDAGAEGLLVACGTQALRLLEVQRQGGRWMRAVEFLRGMPLQAGQQMGT